ncbi:MAG: hypothetical protein RIM72_17650 [Alphaproteobacteria bacterium]
MAGSTRVPNPATGNIAVFTLPAIIEAHSDWKKLAFVHETGSERYVPQLRQMPQGCAGSAALSIDISEFGLHSLAAFCKTARLLFDAGGCGHGSDTVLFRYIA